MKITRTSDQWADFLGDEIEILDPDGWPRDVDSWEHSWFIEQITEQEFRRRASLSTCRFTEKPINATLTWDRHFKTGAFDPAASKEYTP